MAVLCVDAGTSMVKAVIFDEEGRELKVARQAVPTQHRAPGFSEQDMNGVWDAVVYTIRSVVHGVREPVRMLAFTGQGDGCWLVGADGEPTGPAILWNDGRSAGIVDRWEADGVLDRAFRINGNYGFAGVSGAILSWLRAHDRDRLERSHKALYCDGWLFLKFTGEFAAEESDAASPFLDIRSREYSTELLELYDLGWAQRLLPEVRGEGTRVQPLLATAAVELGLPAGLPVVMAPFDIPCTALGIGAVESGQAYTILGTTLSTGMAIAAPDTGGVPSGMTLPSGIPGAYLRSLAAMSGVEMVGWGMELMDLDEPSRLSELAQSVGPGADGVFFHPYLSAAGERAPFRNAKARGSISGLSFEHGRAHLARAMFEGLSFVVRDCLEAAPGHATELRLTGGGANSAFWCQLLADVTGVPTARSVDSEIGAKGALLTALVATGEEPTMASAVEHLVFTRDRFEPDPVRAADYDGLYEDYLGIRVAAMGEWDRLAASRARRAGPAG